MRWLRFPPVFSFLLLILTALLHRRDFAAAVPAPLWGMTISAYVFMCAVSLFFMMRDDGRYNFGISAFAQGLLLTVLSVQFGVRFLSLIGLILFMTGLAAIFLYATHRASPDAPAERPAESADAVLQSTHAKIDALLEKLSAPACYTDSGGVIAGATEAFAEAVGRDREGLRGMLINDVLPIDEDEAVFESGTWLIRQSKEGARFYFSLSPKISKAQAEAPAGQNPLASLTIYDPATSLYTDDYRKIRGPEEVSRAQRYKRQLSGLLVSLSFEPASDVTLSPQQGEMLRNAFNLRVQSTLRTTDCGFLMSDGRVQILLPETPQAGAKTLLSRLITLPQDVFDDEIRGAVNPKVKSGMFFYNGASRMEYGIFSASLEESFIKSKEGTADVSNKAA
jgi:PAS domain-containing protein